MDWYLFFTGLFLELLWGLNEVVPAQGQIHNKSSNISHYYTAADAVWRVGVKISTGKGVSRLKPSTGRSVTEAGTHWEVRINSESRMSGQPSSRGQVTVHRWAVEGILGVIWVANWDQELQAKKLGNRSWVLGRRFS